MEEDFRESEDMQKLDGEEVWSRKHKENACNGGRRRAMPGAAAAAAAVPRCPIRTRLSPAPGWAQRPPGARRASCVTKSQGSTDRRQMFHGKHRFHDF